MEDIGEWRSGIDETDNTILDALNLRMEFVRKIGRYKQERGLDVFDADREEKLLKKLLERNKGPLPDKSLENIYRAILTESRDLQNNLPDE